MSETVTIKGISEGLVITLGKGPLDAVLDEMETLLASKASFFVGGRVALRVGDRPLSVEQLEDIGQIIERCGVTLWAVESDDPTTLVSVKELGLETGLRVRAPAPAPVDAQERVPLEELVGIVVRGTLRSGQAIRHAGHISLIGDVNPGAEIVAGGDVIVWGKLRGIVHAGVVGDDRAVVCALQLAPSQIRIGSHIARPPERSRLPKTPEIASVQDDRIVVERWDKRKQVDA
jgi:septum site-determining protein MinC